MMDCSASSNGYTHCSPEDQIPIIHLLCSWTGHTNDAWYTYAGGRVCCEVEQLPIYNVVTSAIQCEWLSKFILVPVYINLTIIP